VTHAHGTVNMYINDRCRCPECREAARVAKDRYCRLKAYGRWDSGFVPAEPVREHVLRLQGYGIGLNRIAWLAGVSRGTIGKLLYGDPTRGQGPRTRVRRGFAERVFTVRPRLEYVAGNAVVDPTGTRRRVQALVSIGWSQQRIADVARLDVNSLSRVLNGDRAVHGRTALQVKRAFDELWDKPQYGDDWRSRISANRARNYAAARGWVSPLAWDDDTIDDPQAVPDTGSGSGFVHAVDRFDEAVFLLDGGAPVEDVLRRLGYRNGAAFQQAARRYGRYDLTARVSEGLAS
jgi:hypothetical protein